MPQVAECIGIYFHPEYLLATGLSLAAVACVIEGKWSVGGVLVGFAVTAQPLALLVASVLVVLAIFERRAVLAVSAALSFLTVVGPLAWVTRGRVLSATVFGSSRLSLLSTNSSHSTGGTVLWELHLHGTVLFVLARACPIACASAVTWWVCRAWKDRVLGAREIASLAAIAFALRLIFEVNLFGYYFMPVAVGLVASELMSSRPRGDVAIWLGVSALAFNFIESQWEPWGTHGAQIVVAFVTAGVAFLIFRDARSHRIVWHRVGSLIFIVAVFRTQLFHGDSNLTSLPNWVWQVLLVPSVMWLLATNLRVPANSAQTCMKLHRSAGHSTLEAGDGSHSLD
ncbi:MAG: hypothetical protein ACREGR_04005 [Minisyncoccia bacterium]